MAAITDHVTEGAPAYGAGQGPEHSYLRWSKELEGLSLSLQRLADSTEEEFLSVGTRLQDYTQRAREISEMARSAADLMAGDEITAAMEGLQGILERMDQCLNGSPRRSSGGTGILHEIHDMIESARETLPSFRKIVKTLRTLGVSTRIESARLNNVDNSFYTLADDVEELSSLIDQKAADIISGLGALSTLVGQTLANIFEIDDRRKKHSTAVVENAMAGLTALREKHRMSSEAARRISEESGTISRGISEIVASMQFSDIVRQKLQHVQEAFNDLVSGISMSMSGTGREELNSDITAVHVRDVCELQAGHLVSAKNELVNAVENIISSLETVVSSVHEMCSEAHRLAGMADSDDESFLAGMESSIKTITTSLAESARADRELAEALRSVTGTMDSLAMFVKDIEKIGAEIKLIALNARIRAARTGDDGAALGVLAESIHRLSEDSHTRTTAVSEILKQITAASAELEGRTEPATGGDGCRPEDTVENMERLTESLRQVNDRIAAMLQRIDESGSMLAEDIGRITGEINTHRVAQEELERIVSATEKVVQETLMLAPGTPDENREERLRKMEDRYTMQSERNIHQSHVSSDGGQTGLSSAGDGGNGRSGGTTDDTGLGDNVELF